MKLPTKHEIILGVSLALLSILILVVFPQFSSVGWFGILYSVLFFLFPGPQLRSKLERTEAQNSELRENVASSQGSRIPWWVSPVPWGLALVAAFATYAIVT